MLSLARGYSVSYLCDEVARGREGYFVDAVDAGEPDGVWYGAGAAELGLAGTVDADVMQAVYLHNLDPRTADAADPATWGDAERLGGAPHQLRTVDERLSDLLRAEPDAGPERRAELSAIAQQTTRQNLAFLDATFSAPKSVTVLAVAFERAENAAGHRAERAELEGRTEDAERHRVEQAAFGEHRAAVERAVMAGASASVDYLQDRAGYGRVGHHGGGAGRWIDSHKFVVAQFLQHDSRDRDPQLHVHQAILNRQLCADGEWRTLDSKAIHAHRPAASAHGERVLEAELARTLGVRIETRPDGKAREVVGVDQGVMDMFSSRRRTITAAVRDAVALYKERVGREPSALELNRIAQDATLQTRRGKAHDGETSEQRLERWERQTLAELEGGLSRVAREALAAGRAGPTSAARWSTPDVIARAIDNVSRKQQTWSRPDLVRAISDELPGNLGLPAADAERLLERLTDLALQEVVVTRGSEPTAGLPDDLLLANRQSVYQQPAGERFASKGQIAAEQAIAEAGRYHGAPRVSLAEAKAAADRFGASGHKLGDDQRAALIGVLTSGRTIDVVAAPAGAGKSFLLGAISESWTTGRVIGLAPSQVAAKVLEDEGVVSWNLAAWQAAVARGDQDATPRPGDLVVLDEAGMASTPDIAAAVDAVRRADAKVVPVGDPRQLGAVGPGGVLGDLAARGGVFELVDIRRFSDAWEGEASLRLRSGDPSALAAYDRHGRINAAATGDEALEMAGRAWLADTLNGKESLLIVGTNDEAAQASATLRAQLVALGRVEEFGVPLERDGNVAGVGDRVQARRNGWELLGRGNTRAPINRDCYRVTQVREDGSMTVVDGAGVEIALPASYVARDLALAYATTVYGAQGRTVDTGHAVTDGRSDAGSVYVSLTRGREANTAWVVTRPLPSAAPTGEALSIDAREARAVLAEVLERSDDERGALAERDESDAEARSTWTTLDRLIDGVRVSTEDRTSGLLDALVFDGTLSESDRQRLGGDSALGPVDRMLRAGEIAGRPAIDVLREAVGSGSFDGARSAGQVLYSRVRGVIGETADNGAALTSFADLIPVGVSEGSRAYLAELAEAADTRRHELGTAAALDPPAWAVIRLGPVPEDPTARLDWENRVGWAAAWRENQQVNARHSGSLPDGREPDGASGSGGDAPRDPGISAAGPLGAAPPVGLAEKRAVWVTAQAALGGPDSGPEEAGMSDARLRARVVAGERERIWAPRYVADELAATAQAAAKAHADATVWGAHAGAANAAGGPDGPPATAAAAAQALDEARRLEDLRSNLAAIDEARSRWFAHTAPSRDREARARAVLNARGVDPDAAEDRVTAAEWQRADDAARAEEDRRRVIGADEVLDTAGATTEAPTSTPEDLADSGEVGRPDIRETAVEDGSERAQPAREVPEEEPTYQAVTSARAALDEIAERRALEQAESEQSSWVGHDDVAVDDGAWADAM